MNNNPPDPPDPIIEDLDDPLHPSTQPFPPEPATAPPPQSPFSNPINQGFTFDGIPPSKWLDRIFEIHSWCTTELLSPGSIGRSVI